jgi:hypothetical protein
MTRSEVVTELERFSENLDVEVAREMAVETMSEFLRSRGYRDIADAWDGLWF